MKRLGGRISVCFVLGVVTLLALTWGMALLWPGATGGPPTFGADLQYYYSQYSGRLWTITLKRRFGLVEIVSADLVPSGASSQVTIDPGRSLNLQDISQWSLLRREDALNPGVPRMTLIQELGYGWPLPALVERHESVLLSTIAPRLSNAPWYSSLDIPAMFHALGPGRTVPIEPIAIGIVVDVVTLAFGWFTLLWGTGMVKQAVRRSRGCCPQCGYDLRGASGDNSGGGGGCPECGWRRDEHINQSDTIGS